MDRTKPTQPTKRIKIKATLKVGGMTLDEYLEKHPDAILRIGGKELGRPLKKPDTKTD